MVSLFSSFFLSIYCSLFFILFVYSISLIIINLYFILFLFILFYFIYLFICLFVFCNFSYYFFYLFCLSARTSFSSFRSKYWPCLTLSYCSLSTSYIVQLVRFICFFCIVLQTIPSLSPLFRYMYLSI